MVAAMRCSIHSKRRRESSDPNEAITDQFLGEGTVICWTYDPETKQEAIDSDVSLFLSNTSDYAEYLVVALLPEDTVAVIGIISVSAKFNFHQ